MAEQVVIAGVVDEHRIAGCEQITDQQVEPLRGARGQQHLRRRNADAELADSPCDVVAQRRIAERGSEIGDLDAAGSHLPRVPANARFLLPVVGEAAAGVELPAHERDAGVVADDFGNQVREIDGALEAAAALDGGFGHRRCRDVEAGAAARFDVAGGDQPIVGLDDGEAADPVVGGERPYRRQPRAWPQQPRFDVLADPGDYLLDERCVRCSAKLEIKHRWLGAATVTVCKGEG